MFTHRNKGVVVPFAFGRRRPLLVDLQRKDSSRRIVFVFVFADEDKENEEKEEEEESMPSREERVSLLTLNAMMMMRYVFATQKRGIIIIDRRSRRRCFRRDLP